MTQCWGRRVAPGRIWRYRSKGMPRSLAYASIVSLATCQARSVDPDAQSAYVDLYLEDDIEICAGQLAQYDRFIEQAFALWAGESPADFRVAVHVRNRPCSDAAFSCAKPGKVWLGYHAGQYHELAHAITFATDGSSVALLGEGAAEALGPTWPDIDEPPGLTNVSMEEVFSAAPDGLEYSIGSKLTRFLLEQYGSESTRSYYRAMDAYDMPTMSEFSTEFESTFDDPLADAWLDFSSERRCPYDLSYCDDTAPAITLPYDAPNFSCDDSEVQSFEVTDSPPEIRFAPVRIIRIDNAEPLSVVVTYGGVSVHTGRCGDCSEQGESEFRINDGSVTAEWPMELAVGQNVFIVQSLIGQTPTFRIHESQ